MALLGTFDVIQNGGQDGSLLGFDSKFNFIKKGSFIEYNSLRDSLRQLLTTKSN